MYLKHLWELNKRRIDLLKGVKYYQSANDESPASFIKYERDGEIISPTTNIYLAEIYELLAECSQLELVATYLKETLQKGVNIANVVSEEHGKFTINIHHLNS